MRLARAEKRPPLGFRFGQCADDDRYGAFQLVAIGRCLPFEGLFLDLNIGQFAHLVERAEARLQETAQVQVRAQEFNPERAPGHPAGGPQIVPWFEERV